MVPICSFMCDKHVHVHYYDVTMGAIASQIASLTIVYSFIQTQLKENIKALCHWSLCEEFTGDQWIPCTNGQLRGKCFHLMKSSCLGQKFNAQMGKNHYCCFLSFAFFFIRLICTEMYAVFALLLCLTMIRTELNEAQQKVCIFHEMLYIPWLKLPNVFL